MGKTETAPRIYPGLPALLNIEESVFEKHGIIVYGNETLTSDDYGQCGSEGEIVFFEFRGHEFLCAKDDLAFERMAVEFDWDLAGYWIDTGDLETASKVMEWEGITFRNMSFDEG